MCGCDIYLFLCAECDYNFISSQAKKIYAQLIRTAAAAALICVNPSVVYLALWGRSSIEGVPDRAKK